ncbi:MAG: hypothetical protein GWN21_17140 [Gammaproteobacteria bacterium]|nr:hypothetical protein [Gammaproteobacteria bacterium]NIP89992.1 hypothetical protein [Gammaproteobacteria bacterium]NIR24851.1 hypothetical protein [Gammaproteobacteria bacterium]NIS06514.1 hypothetical protein [Gammaproteobacteria bacterium]NIU42645.1 hypothetical protein [Gammaproteobacteria bacterium]
MQLARDTYAPMNEAIRAKLLALARATPDRAPGGKLQTDQTLHQLPEFHELRDIIHAAATGVLEYLRVVYESLELTGCWANISPPGDAHRPHTHPNNYLSGVYYVQTQAGADTISFDDPRPQTNIISPLTSESIDENAGQIHVSTREGLLLLFPSWLQHQVPQNRSERARISIAFNLMFSRFGETMSRPKWQGNVRSA